MIFYHKLNLTLRFPIRNKILIYIALLLKTSTKDLKRIVDKLKKYKCYLIKRLIVGTNFCKSFYAIRL